MNYKINDVVDFYIVRSGILKTGIAKKILKNYTIINVPTFIEYLDKMVNVRFKVPRNKVWKAGTNPFKGR